MWASTGAGNTNLPAAGIAPQGTGRDVEVAAPPANPNTAYVIAVSHMDTPHPFRSILGPNSGLGAMEGTFTGQQLLSLSFNIPADNTLGSGRGVSLEIGRASCRVRV